MAYIKDGRVTLRLNIQDLGILDKEAENKGISLSALIRIIIKEHINE